MMQTTHDCVPAFGVPRKIGARKASEQPAMLSIPHLILLFVIALIVFGPEKLPQLARTLGKVMSEFRKVTGDLRRVVDDEMREMERHTREAEIRKRDAAAQQALPGLPAAGVESGSSVSSVADASVAAPFQNVPTPDAEPAAVNEIAQTTPSMSPPGTVPGERPTSRAASADSPSDDRAAENLDSSEPAAHASS
jgi:TatA/E family protein of Tat protein translocase